MPDDRKANGAWKRLASTSRVTPEIDSEPSVRKRQPVARIDTVGRFLLTRNRDGGGGRSTSQTAKHADDNRRRGSTGCFVRELKPSLAPNERAEFQSVECSDLGNVVVAGGSLLRVVQGMHHTSSEPSVINSEPAKRSEEEEKKNDEALKKHAAASWSVLDKMPREVVVGGVLQVWERESVSGRWEKWTNTEPGLLDVPPVTCMSMSGTCLVTGHSRNEDSVRTNSLHSVAQHLIHGGDVWIWRVNYEEKQLELVHKMGCHNSKVTSVVVLRTPPSINWEDQLRLTTVTTAGDIKVWHGPATALDLAASLPSHSDKVNRLAYLPSENSADSVRQRSELLASASNDKTVRIWNLDDCSLMHTLRHTREVYGVAFQGTIGAHQDGVLCVTASHDQRTRVWHVPTGICVQTLHLHVSPVMSVDFQTNGELLASGCQGHQVVLSDTRSGLLMRTMEGHKAFITSVRFLPNSDNIVSSSLDGTIRVWEVKSGDNSVVELGVTRPGETSFGHDKTVYSLSYSADAHLLATGSRDFTIKLWDTSTLECKHTLIGHRNFVFSVAIHPEGRLCASASHDCTIGVWDTATGQQKQILAQNSPSHTSYFAQLHTEEVSDVAFHPNGHIMASSSYDKRVIIYTVNDIEKFMEDPEGNPWVPRMSLQHHTERIWTVSFSPDGQFLASGAWDSMVYVYGTDTFEKLGEGERMLGVEPRHCALHCCANVWSAEFRPHTKNKVGVLATGAADSKVRIWSNRDNMMSWHIECTLEGHTNTVTGLAWHPDGTRLVSSSFDKTVRLWVQSDSGDMFRYVGYGVWAAYNCPTMAVAWAYKPEEMESGGSMISIATMNSPMFLMDAGDAGQKFMTCARAQHTLQQGPLTWDILLDMVKDFPQTLTSLGSNQGLLLHRVIAECDDHKLLKKFLELTKKHSITPLLPYGPHGKPLLASVNSYHSVAAVVDAIIEMGEVGIEVGASCLSSGTGTCLMLMLIETFPDQAVRLLQYVGMTKSHEIVYQRGWNRRMLLSMDGMLVQPADDKHVGETRYPENLWATSQKSGSFFQQLFNLRPGFSDEEEVMIDVVAVHSSFPHACGMLPHKYSWGPDDNPDDEMDFTSLQRSFLHISYNCGEPRLFDTPLGRAVLQFKWEAFGRKFAGIQLAVFVMHLTLVFLQAFALGRLQGAGGWLSREEHVTWMLFARILGGLVILFSSIQGGYEMCQILAQGPSNYLTDPWNVLDLCVILVCALSGGAVIAKLSWTPYVAAVASFFAWLKVFYFMRAFTATGGLVRMVMQIGYDMRHLLLLLVVVIMAAATSFHVLLPGAWQNCAWRTSSYEWNDSEFEVAYCDLGVNPSKFEDKEEEYIRSIEQQEYYREEVYPGDDDKEPYPPDFWSVLLRVYGMMLGDFKHSWFAKLPLPAVGQVLWVIFMFLEMILLLNLLIALMGDSYEKVQEKSKIEALRERAGLLVEMEMVIEYMLGEKYLLKHNFCPRWLHAVVPKEALQSGAEGQGRTREWSGVAGSIKQDMESSMNQLKMQMREEMDRLHDNLSREVQDKMRELMQSMNDTLASAQRPFSGQADLTGYAAAGSRTFGHSPASRA
mmetsp:Transcript_37622/g.106269  ORF Transcript_37622/g.106269 Transcript_37622/m.106269 type:complete len:1580 (-) Transcript_37622:421-5160(-)